MFPKSRSGEIVDDFVDAGGDVVGHRWRSLSVGAEVGLHAIESIQNPWCIRICGEAGANMCIGGWVEGISMEVGKQPSRKRGFWQRGLGQRKLRASRI